MTTLFVFGLFFCARADTLSVDLFSVFLGQFTAVLILAYEFLAVMVYASVIVCSDSRYYPRLILIVW